MTLVNVRRALFLQVERSRNFVVGSWTQSNFILILALLFSGIRVIVFEHISWYFHPRRIRALRRLIYPFAWRVIVLNPSEFDHYRAFLSNVRLLPNPVPAAEVYQPSKREKLIVAIGHLERRKNFVDAVKAMAASRLEERGWELAIIGGGPDAHLIERTIREAGLTRTCIHPPAADLASWYSRASLTLVTAKLEVFSLVLAEAMAFGVVPICFAADGPSFILKDFSEHLVPLGDVKAMAARMRAFAEQEIPASLRRELASSIAARFSPDAVEASWGQLLEEER